MINKPWTNGPAHTGGDDNGPAAGGRGQGQVSQVKSGGERGRGRVEPFSGGRGGGGDLRPDRTANEG